MFKLSTLIKLALILFTIQIFATEQLHAQSKQPPNIILIMADDMGYGDLKVYNPESKIITPNLDKLAASGMTFTDAHSGGSTCKPSRYSLMTGRFNIRAAHYNDRSGPIIKSSTATIASMLKDQGYDTAMVGKWHLGFDQKGEKNKSFAFAYDQPITGGPRDRGFESFFGMHASLDIPPYFFIQDRTPTKAPTENTEDHNSLGGPENWNRIQGAFWRAGPVGPDFKHIEVTPRFASEASKVIETHDGKKPLFLYLALPSPHTPWLPTKEFQGKSTAGMYGDFVMQVDNVVGQIVASIEKSGKSKDTLILFTSDNGPVWYDKDTERFGHKSVGPLRGIKGSVWEGGHRVPFIVKWPGNVKAGTKTDQLVAFADVFATFAEVSGKKGHKYETAKDSVSFAGTLRTQQTNNRSPVIHAGKTIRAGKWKLIIGGAGRGFNAEPKKKYSTELYNLKEDLSEKNNLAEKMPDKVEELTELLKQSSGK